MRTRPPHFFYFEILFVLLAFSACTRQHTSASPDVRSAYKRGFADVAVKEHHKSNTCSANCGGRASWRAAERSCALDFNLLLNSTVPALDGIATSRFDEAGDPIVADGSSTTVYLQGAFGASSIYSATFVAAPGDRLSVGLSDVAIQGAGEIDLLLLSPSGEPLAYGQVLAGGTTLLLPTASSVGTYQILVILDDENTSLSATLTLSSVAAQAWVAGDTPARLQLSRPGQVFLYDFSISGDLGLTAQVSRAQFAGTMYVTGPSSCPLLSKHFGTEPDVEPLFISGLPSDNYELVVVPDAAQRGEISLSILPGLSTLSVTPTSLLADGNSFATLTYTLNDANGPLPGQAVVLTTVGDRVNLSSNTGTTDNAGQFTAQISSIRAGTKTVKAVAAGAVGMIDVVFIDPGPLPPSSIVLETSSETIVAGAEEATLTVTVLDALERPVANQNVELSTTGTSDMFTPAQGITDQNGVFSAQYSSVVAETKTITAAAGTVVGSAVIDVVAGPPSAVTSSLTISPNVLIADSITTTVVAGVVRDAFGNPVVGQAWTLSSTDADDVFQDYSDVTDAHGDFSTVMKSSATGEKTVTLSVGVAQLVAGVLFTGKTTSLTLTASPNVAVANGTSAITFTVQARDSDGRLVAGQPISVGSLSFGSFSSSSGITDRNGQWMTTMVSTVAEIKNVFAAVPGCVRASTTVTFTAPNIATLVIAGAELLHDLYSGDFDKDGNVDLMLFSADGPPSALIYAGRGDGTFVIHQTADHGSDSATSAVYLDGVETDEQFSFPQAKYSSHVMLSHDFASDGNAELVLLAGDCVQIRRDHTRDSSVSYALGRSEHAGMLALGDLDHDGLQDVVVATSPIQVLFYRKDNTIFDSTVIEDLLGNKSWVLAEDLDQDGYADIVTTTDSGVTVGMGSSTRTFAKKMHFTTGEKSLAIASGDFNHDGVRDLAVLNENKTVSLVFVESYNFSGH